MMKEKQIAEKEEQLKYFKEQLERTKEELEELKKINLIMDLNKLKELSLDKLKALQQEVEDAINIKSTIHYEIGDVLLQKTDSCVKIFKILDKNYDKEFGWGYRANVIKFEKGNIIKYTRYFYTESFDLKDIETIKIDENIWYPLETLYDKYRNQLDKVFDEWKKKRRFYSK